MERRYSASPYEDFFTGGGVLRFENFEKEDNERILPLRDAFRNSVNLVFIRLMRDLVSYHRARLTYDSADVLENPANPERQKMLQEIAEEESRQVLRRAYQIYAKQSPEEIAARLLRTKGNIERRLTILFFNWRIGASESDLKAWFEKNQVPTKDVDLDKLYRAYNLDRLRLSSRFAPARSVVRRRVSKGSRSFLGKTLCVERRSAPDRLGMAAQQPQPPCSRSSFTHPDGARRFHPHDPLLAKARVSFQDDGAELCLGHRQLIGPPGSPC